VLPLLSLSVYCLMNDVGMPCALLVSVSRRQILFYTNSSRHGLSTCPRTATMNWPLSGQFSATDIYTPWLIDWLIDWFDLTWLIDSIHSFIHYQHTCFTSHLWLVSSHCSYLCLWAYQYQNLLSHYLVLPYCLALCGPWQVYIRPDPFSCQRAKKAPKSSFRFISCIACF